MSNFYPWGVKDMCGAHFSMIANEFMMIAILIPLLGFVYKNYYRRILVITFCIFGIFGSMVPVLYMACKNPPVDAYPGFFNNAYDDMMSKIYYRIPPFLIGIALSIFNFEYRYVDKLNDGSTPFHKDFIQKLSQNKFSFKGVCYSIGLALASFTIVLLWANA